MRTRLLSSLTIAAFALTACGGGGGTQDEVADLMIEAAEEEDFDLDEDCVRDVAGKLSDDDAQRLVDAGVNGQAEGLSAEAEELAAEMFGCVDTDALVDSMVDDMIEQLGEENVDVDCLKDAVRDLDISDPEDAAFAQAMFECVNLG